MCHLEQVQATTTTPMTMMIAQTTTHTATTITPIIDDDNLVPVYPPKHRIYLFQFTNQHILHA